MASTNTPIASTSTNHRPPLVTSISQTGDIALWLHNKLGTSNDLWSDNSSIISQLNPDVLRQIQPIFADLQLNVKLKLLLSFLHISRRNLDEWKNELNNVLAAAVNDNEPWVSVVGEMLRKFPSQGMINFEFQSNNSSFFDMVNDIKKLVKKHGDRGILPLESLYLNRKSFECSFGQLSAPVKHFNLRRKAKSATLRVELLQKATDAQTGKRATTGPTVPIRCRGFNSDSTPLKGIPSRNSFGSSYNNSYSSSYGATKGFSRLGSSSTSTPSGPLNRLSRYSSLGGSTSLSSSIKRDGGIVILDIEDVPSMDPKRRKAAAAEEKKKNQDAVIDSISTTAAEKDKISPSSSLPTNLVSSPTPTVPIATIGTSINSNNILGHKSGGLQSVIDETKRTIATLPKKVSDPYEMNEPTGLSSNVPSSNNVQQTTVALKTTTPDYAAGLIGSNAGSSILNKSSNVSSRYSALSEHLSTAPKNMLQNSSNSSSNNFSQPQSSINQQSMYALSPIKDYRPPSPTSTSMQSNGASVFNHPMYNSIQKTQQPGSQGSSTSLGLPHFTPTPEQQQQTLELMKQKQKLLQQLQQQAATTTPQTKQQQQQQHQQQLPPQSGQQSMYGTMMNTNQPSTVFSASNQQSQSSVIQRAHMPQSQISSSTSGQLPYGMPPQVPRFGQPQIQQNTSSLYDQVRNQVGQQQTIQQQQQHQQPEMVQSHVRPPAPGRALNPTATMQQQFLQQQTNPVVGQQGLGISAGQVRPNGSGFMRV
ncbi:hypothetical protein RDWZM_000943 [Blomia tropicalis]|uniref:HDAg domain-containing protein n=1 Tax=Blomia tropicalis TaxID=40697 RepID=A0A9Q0RNG9_BLOTA|nr:hypothetical protein RDWZM_000943 [Blomia tropicalis]